MSNEVKLRKKTQKSNTVSESPKENGKNEVEKENITPGDKPYDFKTSLCVLTLAVCGLLAWFVIQQNERFSVLENKYKLLHDKTTALFTMEEKVLQVSEKCQGVQAALEGLGAQQGSLGPQLEVLKQDVGRLSEWAVVSSEKRENLQGSLGVLTQAVGQIEGRTAAITTDLTNKVGSVKTDVRRMEGLGSEVEALLTQMAALEDQALQVERSTVKRIADLLAASIDRVAALRTAAEENARAIELLQRQLPGLAAADQRISERLRELEAGRARLVRTVTFAGDLKPKVASVRRDLAAFEPRLSDLTLRIGQLAEGLGEREREVAELREKMAALTAAAAGPAGLDSGEVPEVDDIGVHLQGLVSNALRQTEL